MPAKTSGRPWSGRGRSCEPDRRPSAAAGAQDRRGVPGVLGGGNLRGLVRRHAPARRPPAQSRALPCLWAGALLHAGPRYGGNYRASMTQKTGALPGTLVAGFSLLPSSALKSREGAGAALIWCRTVRPSPLPLQFRITQPGGFPLPGAAGQGRGMIPTGWRGSARVVRGVGGEWTG